VNAQYSFQDIFSELRVSFRLSLPLIASEIIYGLSGFISTIMVAHLGSKALAANALVWTVFIALIVFFIGVLCAVSVMVAQCHGANDKEGIRIASKQGILLAIALSIPMMLVVLFAPYILSLTGQHPAVMQLATPYFHSMMWSMLPLNLLFVFEQFLLGLAKTRLVLAMSILGVPIQIGFIYLFTFGAFGFPKMGLSGIGFGCAAAYGITAVIVGLYIQYAKPCRDYEIFSGYWTLNKKYMKEIIRVGLPMGSMYCVELALFAIIAIFMGRIGADALAAHQIAYQCFGLALTVIFG
jgi:MATE family multidrug resistance protein